MLSVILLVLLIQLTTAQVTSNTQVNVTSDYREIQFELKPDVTENKSLTIMFVTHGQTFNSTYSNNILTEKRKLVVEGLPLSSVIYYTLFNNEKYDSAKTKVPSPTSATVTPDPPKDIEVCGNEICWKTPDNVVSSTTTNDKSIEYNISVCNYNPLIKEISNCQFKGVVVDNGNINQSTSDWKNSKIIYEKNGDITIFASLYKSFEINSLTKNRDILIQIQPVSLSNVYGKSGELITRLDNSTEPPAPEILKLKAMPNEYKIYVQWSPYSSDNGAIYRIEYKPTSKSDAEYKNVIYTALGAQDPDSGINQKDAINILASNSMLEKNTNYTVRVAIFDSKNGASKWSAVTTFTTGQWTTSSASHTSATMFMLVLSCLLVVITN